MIINWKNIKIYVKPGITDMRKQINGLSIIVQEELDIDVFSETLFLFCSKNKKRLKILYWDRNGFCMWLKRLEKDTFPWPKNKEEVKEITKKQFKMLLDGIDFFKAYKKLNYKNI